MYEIGDTWDARAEAWYQRRLKTESREHIRRHFRPDLVHDEDIVAALAQRMARRCPRYAYWWASPVYLPEWPELSGEWRFDSDRFRADAANTYDGREIVRLGEAELAFHDVLRAREARRLPNLDAWLRALEAGVLTAPAPAEPTCRVSFRIWDYARNHYPRACRRCGESFKPDRRYGVVNCEACRARARRLTTTGGVPRRSPARDRSW